MTGYAAPVVDNRLADLLTRFGSDFNRHSQDLTLYYSEDFTAVVGDDVVDRSAYLASVATMYDAGARDIRFEIDLCRALNAELILASGTTQLLDGDGVQHASRFTILCGSEPLRFLHVHSSPPKLAA